MEKIIFSLLAIVILLGGFLLFRGADFNFNMSTSAIVSDQAFLKKCQKEGHDTVASRDDAHKQHVGKYCRCVLEIIKKDGKPVADYMNITDLVASETSDKVKTYLSSPKFNNRVGKCMQGT